MPFIGVLRSQAETQKGAKFPLFDFDETVNQRTHYSQITTSTLKMFFIGVTGPKFKPKNRLRLKNVFPIPIPKKNIFNVGSGILAVMCHLVFSFIKIG